MTTLAPEEQARTYARYHPLLKIRDRETKELVPLTLNETQRTIARRVRAARLDNRPFRGIVLKARQLGVSTYWQSRIAQRAFTRPGVRALTIAHDDEATQNLHAMLEEMYAGLPDWIRPAKDSQAKGHRLWLEHGSRINVRTAGAREVGRSLNLTDAHISELPMYPDADTTMTGVMQAIQYLPGTAVLIEATAKGIGNVFHQECKRARAVDPRFASFCSAESDYEFFFFPWFDDERYTRPIPVGGLGVLDGEEEHLRVEYGVSDEQLAWRRHTLRNECRGNIDILHQEYPAWPEQAFLSSGRRFFAEERVSRIVVAAPKRRGELRGEYPAPYTFTTHSEGRLRYWEAPITGHKYVVAVDPSGEIPEAEAEEYAGVEKNKTHDPSSMHVADCSTGRLVAAWHDPHPDLSELGTQAAMLGKLYNHAMIGVETTGGYGWPVIQTLEQLRYRYVHTTRRQEVVDGKARWTTRLGYDTTETTRPRVLALLDDTIRDHPDALPDAELQSEMRTFVVRRRAQHDLGCHDDRVFSAAWALELARLYPQKTAHPDRKLVAA